MRVGKQVGSDDCGLYAIAILTALAYKINVAEVKFDQSKMRRHFIDCIEAKFLTLFPSQARHFTDAIIKSLCI